MAKVKDGTGGVVEEEGGEDCFKQKATEKEREEGRRKRK